MPKIVYIDDIYKMIEFLPDERMNPLEDEYSDSCVYTDSIGNHCIAGQILTMLGFKVPEYEAHNNINPVSQVIDELYPDSFDDDAVVMLSVGQNTADKLTHYDDKLAWGFAKRDMINYFRKTRKEEIAQRNLQAGH